MSVAERVTSKSHLKIERPKTEFVAVNDIARAGSLGALQKDGDVGQAITETCM